MVSSISNEQTSSKGEKPSWFVALNRIYEVECEKNEEVGIMQ